MLRIVENKTKGSYNKHSSLRANGMPLCLSHFLSQDLRNQVTWQRKTNIMYIHGKPINQH